MSHASLSEEDSEAEPEFVELDPSGRYGRVSNSVYIDVWI